MFLNKQDSEYASGPEYAKISEYGRVLNMQELHKVLNMPPIWLNMSEQDVNMPEYV